MQQNDSLVNGQAPGSGAIAVRGGPADEPVLRSWADWQRLRAGTLQPSPAAAVGQWDYRVFLNLNSR